MLAAALESMARHRRKVGPEALSASASSIRGLPLAWAALLLSACGAAETAPAAIGTGPVTSPFAGVPLIALPPPGADWLLRVRPKELFANPALAPLIQTAVPPRWVERLARQTGLDLPAVEELVIAAYEDGFLLLVECPLTAAEVVGALAGQMHPVDTVAHTPYERRGGMIDAHRVELVAIDRSRLLVAVRAPGPFLELLNASIENRQRLPADWQTFVALARDHDHAPASMFVPKPLALPVPRAEPATDLSAAPRATSPESSSENPSVGGAATGRPQPANPSRGLALLLSRQEQLVLSLLAKGVGAPPPGSAEESAGGAVSADPTAPSDPPQVVLHADLTGEFPDSALENFTTMVRSMSESDFGRALGIEPDLRGLNVQVRGQRVEIRLFLQTSRLARVLQMLLLQTVGEAVELL